MQLSKKLNVLSKIILATGVISVVYFVNLFYKIWGAVLFDPAFSVQVKEAFRFLIIKLPLVVISTAVIYYVLKSLSFIVSKFE